VQVIQGIQVVYPLVLLQEPDIVIFIRRDKDCIPTCQQDCETQYSGNDIMIAYCRSGFNRYNPSYPDKSHCYGIEDNSWEECCLSSWQGESCPKHDACPQEEDLCFGTGPITADELVLCCQKMGYSRAGDEIKCCTETLSNDRKHHSSDIIYHINKECRGERAK